MKSVLLFFPFGRGVVVSERLFFVDDLFSLGDKRKENMAHSPFSEKKIDRCPKRLWEKREARKRKEKRRRKRSVGEHFKENSEEESVRKAEGGDGSSLTSCRRKGGRKACIPLCSHIPSVCSGNRPHPPPFRNEQQKVPICEDVVTKKAGRE